MKKTLFAILMLLVAAGALKAQPKSDLVQSRILILLDESSSMVQKWSGGKPKYQVSEDIILRIMDSVYSYNPDVEFSLRVFGHQHPVQENNCYDTRNEVAFTKGNRTQMELRLNDIRPLGVTPIAYALKQAAENDIVDEVHNAYSIILITDGGESCGGDLCEVMRTLIASKVFFKPYIVGLEDAPELRLAYACMGNFLSVTKDGDIPDAVSRIVTGFRPIIRVTKSDYKEIKELGANAPSVLRVTQPSFRSEPPKKEIQPPAPPINHLSVAPVRVETPEVARTNIPMVPVPGPPAQTVDMPSVPPIEHLLNASLKDLAGYSFQQVPLHKVALPVVTEEISLPPVGTIRHLEPAPVGDLPGFSQAQSYVNRAVIPAAPDVQDEVVITLPPVPHITHVNPVGVRPPGELMASATPMFPVKLPAPPVIEEPVVKEEIVLPKVPRINHIAPARIAQPDAGKPEAATLNKVPVTTVAEPEIHEEPARPAVTKISKFRPAHMIEPRVIFIIEDHPLRQRTPPPPPSFAPIPSPALLASKPSLGPTPAPPSKPGVGAGIKSTYTVETVDASETSIQVYFTNGHGKYYESMPQVVLLEPFSNKVAKKFYRTIDPAGVPDVVKDVPAGTYNIAIADKRNLVLYNTEIVANKLTKVICTLKNCSLVFEYDSAQKRPVSEFVATVIQRNVANGKVINQKCTQKLEYEPGNYHIVIHTYPEDVRNVDLDFDDTKVILLKQPGFVKMTTELKNRKLNLYKPVNDKYLQFDTKNSNDTTLQHLQIQPGQYQVRYLKDPTKPYSKETVVPFSVTSNQTTEIELPK